jgi:hypothetical protein
VADDLRGPGALDAALARPSVYVRGPIGAFKTPATIADAAASSTKDALVLCLLDPPESRAEKTIAAKVRAAYGGNAQVAARTAQVRRLRDVDVAVRALAAPWADRASATEDPRELSKIKDELAKIPLDDARRAARAEILIATMDELDEAVPAELDGERAHHVRVALIDLEARRSLARARRRVDPSWLSAQVRSSYAGAVDACALALDVRAAVLR